DTHIVRIRLLVLERETSLELATSTLARLRSTDRAVRDLTTGREIYQLPHRIAILQNHFVTGGATRNRTGVHGFAGRCITTLPSRHDRFGRLPLNRWSLRARHPPDRRILGAGNESRTRDLNLGKV